MAFDRPNKIERIMQIVKVKNKVIWQAIPRYLGTQYINSPNRFRSNLDIICMFISVSHDFYANYDLIVNLCRELFEEDLLGNLDVFLQIIRDDLTIPSAENYDML